MADYVPNPNTGLIQNVQTLPPAAPDANQLLWVHYLNQSPVYTPDLMEYRHGYLVGNRLDSSRNLMNTQYRAIPVPHPQMKHYSMIETAKRNRAEAERMARMNQRVRIRGVEQRPPWVRPDRYEPFDRFRPNLNIFTKPLIFRMPKWVI